MKKSILFILFAAVLLLGCASNSEVKQIEQPTATPAVVSKVLATPTPTPEIKTAKEAEAPSQSPAPTATPTATPIVTPTPTPEIKTAKEAEVGQTLGNDKLKITLNSAEFKDIIQGESEYSKAEAKEGKTFAIADVTVENADSKPTSISSIMQFKVKDKDQGYSYNADFMATITLEQQIDGTIQPGDKIRGKIAFEVPKDASSLQLVFDFGLIDQAQAKFNLRKS